jgi:hypothetical protein
MKKNPITFFREANETRQAKVKKSLKKAQYGLSSIYPDDNFPFTNITRGDVDKFINKTFGLGDPPASVGQNIGRKAASWTKTKEALKKYKKNNSKN